MKLLVLSNGHGEDIIAVRILEQLIVDRDDLKISALPIVGRGVAYQQKNIPLIGEVKQMPSGGFIYMDSNQLWRDVRGGLVQLTIKQLQVVRQWGKDGGFILAVGDVVPLLFAWLSGANYAFVGTARSEYYLRDRDGWLKQTSWLERQSGSVYHPLDRWLMSRPRCHVVFPRDKLTTEVLQQYSIKAFNLGNPMMDGMCQTNITIPEKNTLSILLLPGSRIPEAEQNWQQIIEATKGVIANFTNRPLLFLAAIAPGLKLDPFVRYLLTRSWQQRIEVTNYIQDDRAVSFTKQNATLLLTQNAYQECLSRADIAIAMAGTATEQFVGLGKPVITMPGKGPQFTYAFAEAQTRLLGYSVILVENPEQVGNQIKAILNNPEQMQRIAVNGQQRMGNSGAASRIAQNLAEILSKISKN
ncbi:MAG: lipid-A-disaccharide synthase-related protein [Xenococcaceae cyanobacterium MO_188.B32]|nr:lipid-A-disaccharide synthase-related protein [Xenococcaceae cyanobacterium MO_188.B32]